MKLFSLFRRRTAGRTRAQAEAAARSSLQAAGWTLAPPAGIEGKADFCARRGNDAAAVLASGTDHPLLATQVSDLAAVLAGGGFHPVFAAGERVDPLVLDRVATYRGVVMVDGDGAELAAQLDALPPSVGGSVDVAFRSGELCGWAKFSHGAKPAEVEAWLGEERIGAVVADTFREDLQQFGDGRYGFYMPIPPIEDEGAFLNRLRVRVLRDGAFIGVVPLSPDMKVVG